MIEDCRCKSFFFTIFLLPVLNKTVFIKNYAMKTLLLIPLLFIVTAFRADLTTQSGDNPIPSYNVHVEGYANFVESGQNRSTDQVTGKRGVNVQVHTESGGNAAVWVYSLDLEYVYGPYTVRPGDPFNYEIDDRLWGVLVYSQMEDLVDVWIE